MKILFVNNFRYRGGGEEFLLDLLPGLAEKGVKIGVVCRPNTPLAALFKGMPIKVYPFEKSGFSGLSSFFKIAKIIRDDKYEIISIQRGHDIIQAWIASILSGARPRLLYTVHVADFIKSRFLLSRMDRIITISRHIEQKIVAFAPGLSGQVAVIHNGIDCTAFAPGRGKTGFVRKKFNLSPNTPLISTSGSMWKNQIEFLDALVDIKREIPDVRYLLLTAMADMPQFDEFKQHAATLGVADTVLWMDAIPKADVPAYYADIDLAISTFRKEGFGIWVVEALAMGTPVVAFDGGGVRDSLEGCPAGVLVKNGAKGMAAEVIRLLKDSNARKQMSEAGPRWVAERFSRERMIEDYYRLFDSLMKK